MAIVEALKALATALEEHAKENGWPHTVSVRVDCHGSGAFTVCLDVNGYVCATSDDHDNAMLAGIKPQDISGWLVCS